MRPARVSILPRVVAAPLASRNPFLVRIPPCVQATSTLTSSLFDSSKAKGTTAKKTQEPDKALAYHYGVFGSLIDDEINEGRNRTLPGTGADCVDKATSREGADSLSALLMKPKAGKGKGTESGRSTMLQELTHTLKKKKEVCARFDDATSLA